VFENHSDEELQVYWVSQRGEEVYQLSVAPGIAETIESYLGHTFHIKTPSGLAKHVVNDQSTQAQVDCHPEHGAEKHLAV